MLLHKCWLIGPGPGLDDIKEVACMDEDVGFLLPLQRGLFNVRSGNVRFAGSSTQLPVFVVPDNIGYRFPNTNVRAV
jgi:hypothetical protein